MTELAEIFWRGRCDAMVKPGTRDVLGKRSQLQGKLLLRLQDLAYVLKHPESFTLLDEVFNSACR